jgi:hypothetical protein
MWNKSSRPSKRPVVHTTVWPSNASRLDSIQAGQAYPLSIWNAAGESQLIADIRHHIETIRTIAQDESLSQSA